MMMQQYQRGLVTRAKVRAYLQEQSSDPLAELRLRSLARSLHWLEQGLQRVAEQRGWVCPWL